MLCGIGVLVTTQASVPGRRFSAIIQPAVAYSDSGFWGFVVVVRGGGEVGFVVDRSGGVVPQAATPTDASAAAPPERRSRREKGGTTGEFNFAARRSPVAKTPAGAPLDRHR
jgi:hypothetical protein